MKRLVAAVAVLAAVLAACSDSAHSANKPIVYVAVGASDSVGVGSDNPATDAWPRVLQRTALPRNAEFHDVAVGGATAADALRTQVPEALAFKPTLVTVWLSVNDVIGLVPPSKYEQTLRQVVHALRRGGAAQVLVGNTPPVEDLPAFARRFAFVKNLVVTRVNEYNVAIARVVKDEGAILVDLHAAGVRSRKNGTEQSLISGDGFHPNTAGYAAVAAAFAARLPSAFSTNT